MAKGGREKIKLEAACGCEITLDRIVYHVKEPATFAIWKLSK